MNKVVCFVALIVLFAGCAAPQTAQVGETVRTDPEAMVLKAIQSQFSGQELLDVKITSTGAGHGEQGVERGFVSFSTENDRGRTEYLYKYEIIDGKVTLRRSVIRNR